jgi:hypothetical protein
MIPALQSEEVGGYMVDGGVGHIEYVADGHRNSLSRLRGLKEIGSKAAWAGEPIKQTSDS